MTTMKIALCFDIGGSAVKAGVVDCVAGALLRCEDAVRLPTHSAQDFAKHLPAIAADISSHFADASVSGVGVSVAALCRNGIVAEAPNLKWYETPLRDLIAGALAEKFGTVPVVVENDADCFTLGESRYGVAKGYGSVLGLTLGTGIGGGLVIGGKIFHGGQGFGIEPGHSKIPLDMEWPECGCGGKYCLEAGAAARGIIWTYGEKGGAVDDGTTVQTIADLAVSGDEVALRTFRRVGMRLGIGIAGMCNMFNPEAVVLGGGISGARHFIEPMLRSHLETETLVSIRGNAALLWSELQNKANLRGAACALEGAIERSEYSA